MGSRRCSAMKLTTLICLISLGAFLTLVGAKPRASAMASAAQPCFDASCKSDDDCCYDDYFGEQLVCVKIGKLCRPGSMQDRFKLCTRDFGSKCYPKNFNG